MNYGEFFRFLREFFRLRNLFVLALLTSLSVMLEHSWLLQYPGLRLMQALDQERAPVLAKDVVLVTITKKEYDCKKLFNGRSPLDATRLFEAVDKIQQLEPQVLAVDIDTSDKSFENFRKNHLKTNLIWARGVGPSGNTLKAEGFLGKDAGESRFAGIAGFERDPDWTIRKLQECITLDGKKMRTFHSAIVRASNNATDETCTEHDLIGTRYNFPTLTLTQVEEAVRLLPKAGTNERKAAVKDNLLRGKIVLLGGTYSMVDYHPGPYGLIPGVELVGAAVQAQKTAESSHERLQAVLAIVAEILLGILIAWVYFQPWHPLIQLSASLLLAGAFLFLPGVLLYWFGFWTVNPFLLAMGMMISQMYEASRGHANEVKRLRRVVNFSEEEKIRVEYSSSDDGKDTSDAKLH